jgi:hypothetical protein
MATGGRRIVRLDSLVEAVLGAFCVGLAALAPHDGPWRLPAHLNVVVVWILALGLLALAAVLWRSSARPDRSLLIALAAGNTITAVLIVVCLSTMDAGWAVDGLLIAAPMALIALAVAQTVIVRRQRATTTR